MVKLSSPYEQPARAVGERGSFRPRRRGFGWRNRRVRNDPDWVVQLPEPSGLHQLEELARKAVAQMEKYNPKSESNNIHVMDLLRCQYNMNFIVLCEKCGSVHNNEFTDIMLAPER